MENFQSAQTTFAAVTLQRPMKLFKGALTKVKVYGEPFYPDLDFLVRLITDYRSHQAMIRQSAGNHFKNFENHMRGKHQQSTSTLQGMSQILGVEPADIASWVHGKQDGPLVPEVLKFFSLVESIPYKFASHTLDTELLCPCCEKNILDDRDAFWNKQTVTYNEPEYSFADRILTATIGASFFGIMFVGLTCKQIDWPDIFKLAQPDKHPIGNWLSDIQDSYGATSLANLVVKIQQMESPELHVPYERLKKWSSGMDLMPVTVAKALSKASGYHNYYWISFFLARALSFAVDFLMAATPVNEPKRQIIQSIVEDRFVGLGQNLRIAMAKWGKEAKIQA